MATLRRSSRIQGGKRDNSKKSATQGEFENSHVQGKPVRKAKRAKTVATTKQVSDTNANPDVFRRTRGKRGLLEKLGKEAPLDILVEVFKHLESQDILHLSRTSKDFRRLLMANSSLYIWREARENTPDLPPLPFDLNEPQYASLLFGNHCDACLRSPCDNVIWESRVRCHKTCMSRLFKDCNQLQSRLFLNYNDFEKVIQHAPYYCGKIYRSNGALWFTRMVKRLVSQYKRIQHDESAVGKWIEEKKEHFELIEDHAIQCMIWDRDRRAEREKRLQNKRRQEIITRLSASGWGPEELNHRHFISHPLLKRPKPVTERTWNYLEPQLIGILQTVKDRRLKETIQTTRGGLQG